MKNNRYFNSRTVTIGTLIECSISHVQTKADFIIILFYVNVLNVTLAMGALFGIGPLIIKTVLSGGSAY